MEIKVFDVPGNQGEVMKNPTVRKELGITKVELDYTNGNGDHIYRTI